MPSTIRLHRVVATKPEKLYRAFLEPDAIASWLPPNGFICTVQWSAPAGGGGGLANPLSEPEPATPASGVSIYARNLAGRRLPAWKGPDGRLGVVLPHLARTRSGLLLPAGGTVLQALGINPATAVGTATARNPAGANLLVSTKRIGYVSAATAGSSAEMRALQAQYWRGSAAGLGGLPPHRPLRAVEPGDRRGTALLRRPRRDDRSAGQCGSVRDRGHGGSR